MTKVIRDRKGNVISVYESNPLEGYCFLVPEIGLRHKFSKIQLLILGNIFENSKNKTNTCYEFSLNNLSRAIGFSQEVTRRWLKPLLDNEYILKIAKDKVKLNRELLSEYFNHETIYNQCQK